MDNRKFGIAFLVMAGLLMTAPSMAQRGVGPMGKGPGGDPAFAADRDLFHELLQHRADIRRDVKKQTKESKH